MEQERFAEFDLLVDEAIREAERRLSDERAQARKRAVQLAREQGYHRLAVAIDRPERSRSNVSPGQLCLFPTTDPSLFDGSSD